MNFKTVFHQYKTLETRLIEMDHRNRFDIEMTSIWPQFDLSFDLDFDMFIQYTSIYTHFENHFSAI